MFFIALIFSQQIWQLAAMRVCCNCADQWHNH